MIDLGFTEEQEMLRQAVGALCDNEASLERVRALENDAVGYDLAFWSRLTELGVVGAFVPEDQGGSAMSLVDAVVVYEEFGRSLAPSPHLVSSVLSAGVLTRAGTGEQQAMWLPAIASGEAIIIPA